MIPMRIFYHTIGIVGICSLIIVPWILYTKYKEEVANNKPAFLSKEDRLEIFDNVLSLKYWQCVSSPNEQVLCGIFVLDWLMLSLMVGALYISVVFFGFLLVLVLLTIFTGGTIYGIVKYYKNSNTSLRDFLTSLTLSENILFGAWFYSIILIIPLSMV